MLFVNKTSSLSMELALFMDKSPRNSSLSMKLALFMDNCLLKCSLSMELVLFMDKSLRNPSLSMRPALFMDEPSGVSSGIPSVADPKMADSEENSENSGLVLCGFFSFL